MEFRHVAARSSLNHLARTPPLEDGEPAAEPTKRRALHTIWENGVRTVESISVESTPPLSPYATEFGNEIKEAYYTLVEMGGRPTREIRLDPGLPDPIEAQRGFLHYQSFWCAQLTFKDELYRWQRFRHHQQKARERPEDFPIYCESVRDYRRANKMEGEIHLYSQWDQQTKLNEWKEYQFFLHRDLGRRRARLNSVIERAQRYLDTGGDREASAERDQSQANEDLEKLDDLWEWVEQQLFQIASDPAIPGLEDKRNSHINHDQAQRGGFGPLRDNAASATSTPNRPSTAGDRERKQRETCSKPTHETSIYLAGVLFYDRRHKRHECQVFDCNAFGNAIIDPIVSEPKSKLSKVRRIKPAPLRPIHSSRVSKSNGKRSTEMHMNDTKLLSPLAQTRPDKDVFSALTQALKMSRPTAGFRRSARIAEKGLQLKNTGVRPETAKTIDAQILGVSRAEQAIKESTHRKTRSLTKTKTGKKGCPTGDYPPTSSKPQGFTKRRGHSRSRQLRQRKTRIQSPDKW